MVTMGVAEPAPEVERAGRGVARLDLQQDTARAAAGRRGGQRGGERRAQALALAAGIDLDRLYNELAAYTDEIRASPSEHDAGALRHRARLFIERRRAPKIIFVG